MTPEELTKKGEQIWKHLDELAASDPIAYQEYVQTALQEASANLQAQSHIKPGFSVQTTEANDTATLARTWHVNFAQTTRLPAPPKDDPLNIPICVSEIRTAEDRRSKVVDIVVNVDVMEKSVKNSFFKSDLINLGMDCVKETHAVTLVKRTNKIYDKEYRGPFGWDEKGKPLSDKDIKARTDIKILPENDGDIVTPDIDTSNIMIPSGMPATRAKAARSAETVDVRPPPFIEVVKSQPAPDIQGASWTKKETESHAIFYCYLPNTTSQSQIEIYFEADKIIVKTSLHYLELPFGRSVADKCVAKFIKSSETLKLKLQLFD
ncbi:PIH1 family [Chytriomyces sp. MP71]|nr:PIH1 family [Chytriomyces sp. MP71]